MASAPVPRIPRRRSFAGPIVLITLGVIFLLGNIGVVTWGRIIYWFAHYWPVLLILWGVVKLVEYFHAQRAGYTASGIGAGGVFLLLFVIFCGTLTSLAVKQAGNTPIMINGEPFSPFGKTYTFEEQVEQPFAPGSKVRVASAHGDILINAWDQNKIKIVTRKKSVAENEEQAKKNADAAHVSVNTAGNVVSIDATSIGPGNVQIAFFTPPPVRADLEIFVPQKAAAEIENRHGDVRISGREGAITINAAHGDIVLDGITGNTELNTRHGEVRASNLTGDLMVDGRVDDLAVSDVKGTVTLSGDFFNSLFRNISKGVRFTSSKTDMQTGRIEGELRMDSGDLHASQLTGLKIHTRSKDMHLEGIAGDVDVANKNASVELHIGKLAGNISVSNDRGNIELYAPVGAAFQIEARTHGGDIESDFDELKVQSSGNDASVSGVVGGRGSKIQLTTEHGDIEIRKAS